MKKLLLLSASFVLPTFSMLQEDPYSDHHSNAHTSFYHHETEAFKRTFLFIFDALKQDLSTLTPENLPYFEDKFLKDLNWLQTNYHETARTVFGADKEWFSGQVNFKDYFEEIEIDNNGNSINIYNAALKLVVQQGIEGATTTYSKVQEALKYIFSAPLSWDFNSSQHFLSTLEVFECLFSEEQKAFIYSTLEDLGENDLNIKVSKETLKFVNIIKERDTTIFDDLESLLVSYHSFYGEESFDSLLKNILLHEFLTEDIVQAHASLIQNEIYKLKRIARSQFLERLCYSDIPSESVTRKFLENLTKIKNVQFVYLAFSKQKDFRSDAVNTQTLSKWLEEYDAQILGENFKERIKEFTRENLTPFLYEGQTFEEIVNLVEKLSFEFPNAAFSQEMRYLMRSEILSLSTQAIIEEQPQDLIETTEPKEVSKNDLKIDILNRIFNKLSTLKELKGSFYIKDFFGIVDDEEYGERHYKIAADKIFNDRTTNNVFTDTKLTNAFAFLSLDTNKELAVSYIIKALKCFIDADEIDEGIEELEDIANNP
ncbi:MAG TPA: hypothetical protein VI959_01120 [Alphaproteobacteria bacterium]|nr:hypothetical protein [Alphaproteobacteria bacterium]